MLHLVESNVENSYDLHDLKIQNLRRQVETFILAFKSKLNRQISCLISWPMKVMMIFDLR